MTRARVAWLLVIAYAAVIIGLSSIPGRSLPEAPVANLDKLVHACIYAMLAALVCRAGWLTGRRSAVAPILAVIVATGFGGLDELYQSFTPGRFSSVFDLIADAIGACLGATAAWGILRRYAASKLRG